MNSLLKLWLLITLIIGFSIFVFFNIWYLNNSAFCTLRCSAKTRVIVTIIVISITGLFVGTLTTYFVSEKYEKKRKKIDAVFRFLDHDERAIVRYIVKSNGKTTQNKISSDLKMSRVKVSRTLRILLEKNVIVKRKNGMTNSIELSDDLKTLFLE